MNIDNNSLRAMTFNVRYENEIDNIYKNWDTRKKLVAGLIKFHKPDIIGLQEALKNQLDYIADQLEEYDVFGVGREDGKEKGEFSPIFFVKDKFQLLDKGFFWLSETPSEVASIGWDAALTRIITWTKLQNKSTKQNIFVFNGHFDHFGKVAAVESARLVLDKINEIAKEEPVLFMGDLNNTPISEMYKVLTEGGLNDCMENSHYGTDFSFIGFDPIKLYYENIYQGMDSITEENYICKIDYIFYKNKVKILQYGILSDNFSGIYPSDHMPAVTDILIYK